MDVSGRRRLLGILVGVFFLQTWLVYSDTTGRAMPALSARAREGQRVWLDHNCQSCHQLFGFGGFLGPDLTNAAPSLTAARLDLILTDGTGRMPAFHLPPGARRAVLQFLVEVDRTGVSQPRYRKRQPLSGLLSALVEKGAPLTGIEAAGLATVREQKCIACHLPNFDTPVRAPDLTGVLDRRGEAGVRAVLAAGVPGTVMPKFHFSKDQQDGVLAFLAWLRTHKDRAARVFEVTRPGGGSLWAIPWFEYE